MQFPGTYPKVISVTQPLALLLYERLLPGSQLVNRFQDLGYRVSTVSGPTALVDSCLKEKPILLVADVRERDDRVCAALRQLTTNPDTSHIPIIATVPAQSPEAAEAARQSGVKLVVHDSVILAHLEQFIDQALQLD